MRSGYYTFGPQGSPSALDIYLGILEEVPDHYRAKQAIKTLRQSFVSMISELIAVGEFNQAARLITRGASLNEPFSNNELKAQLRELAEQIETLKDNMSLRRESYQSAKFEPLESFQDPLKDGNDGPVMVFIPEGTVFIGTPVNEVGRDADEGPMLELAVPRFAVSAYEITFDEYDQFARNQGHDLPDDNGWGRGQRPVINTSWRDALAYAHWLSLQTGYRYRLLSEVEWEYVARAGGRGRYHSGNCLSGTQANFKERGEMLNGCTVGDAFVGRTLEVGSFEPNAWGLYDIHGNVREWVADCWANFYRQTDATAISHTEGLECGVGGKRVLRGGSWDANALSSRIGNRFAAEQSISSHSFGFRLAREIAQ